MLKNFIAVGLGGAMGAMLRYAMTLMGTALGWSGNISTFLANIFGSFAMGCLMGTCRQGTWLLFATVGICGGFTTFSTFSMQSVTLLQQGKAGSAALYAFGTLAACVVMAWLGFIIGQKLLSSVAAPGVLE